MSRHLGTVGELLMARRGLMGLSQAELARRSRISPQTINNLEQGKTKLPRPDKRRKLVEALGGFHVELLVAAGEITPEEIIEGANAYDPKRAEAVSPFPKESPGARIVDLIKAMSDQEIEVLERTAKDIVNLRQYRESSGPSPKRQVG